MARLFSNYRELVGILNRHKEFGLAKSVEVANRTRHLRQLMPGEIVFRRMPMKARLGKHLLGEPSSGPYVVVAQNTFSSAKLKDPATGEMVDQGADIPLEQILVGPRRSQLKFEVSDGTSGRSIGQMLGNVSSSATCGTDASTAGTEARLPPQVVATGWKPGKKNGWQNLAKGQVIAYRGDSSREVSEWL